MHKVELNNDTDQLIVTVRKASDNKLLYKKTLNSVYMCNINANDETEVFSLGALGIIDMAMHAHGIAEGLVTYCKGIKEGAKKLIAKGEKDVPIQAFLAYSFADSLLDTLKDFDEDVQNNT